MFFTLQLSEGFFPGQLALTEKNTFMQQRRKLQTHFSLKPKLITKQQTFVGCYTYLLLMLLFYKFKGWKISNGFTNSHISER